eukprot:COSAG03_NODE_26237_length_260_cov_0.956522_1_plen_23_part_10
MIYLVNAVIVCQNLYLASIIYKS